MYESLESRVLFDSTFTPSVTYHTGSGPEGITVADFNGDGKADLGVTHVGPGSQSGVNCLLGKGGTKFTAVPGATVGDLTLHVVHADFDGDGREDIATTYGTGYSVVRGLGKGKFAVRRDYAIGAIGSTWVEGIVAIDVNHDGHTDIAVSDNRGVRIALNGGAGTFHSARLYESQNFGGLRSAGRGLATADFNGDGFPDLVGNGFDSALTVYFNRGDGSFNSNILLSTKGKSVTSGLVVGDFNRDHKADIAVACHISQCIAYFQNNGGTSFEAASIIPFVDGLEGDPELMTTGDFNGDHRLDLAVLSTNQQVQILNGKGNGTFRNGALVRLHDATDLVAGGDLNGDGRTDLVISQYYDKSVAIVLM